MSLCREGYMKLVFWLCLYGTIYLSVEAQNCIYQGCYCSQNYTSCINQGWLSIPPTVGTGFVTDLTLDYNSISSLPAQTLPPNLHSLSMMSNPVTFIADSAFDDSKNTLTSVQFSSANFTQIPSALGRLRRLSQLSISDTKILDWNGDVMKNLGPTLSSLYLSNCSINLWPEWLKYNRNLTFLNLENNFISTIPDDGLDSVADTLTSLNLHNNTLRFISRAFAKMTALQSLYLPVNRITNVTWLPPYSKLNVLSIDNNKIYDGNEFSAALLPYADSLYQLDIGANSFLSLPNLSFLHRVTYLDFSYNQISDSITGSLPSTLNGMRLDYNTFRSIPRVVMSVPSVTFLNINNNMLTQIRDVEFPSWTVGANFGFNFITELTDASFPVNCSLQFIDLNNNPLTRISSQAFLHVPLLNYLDLKVTRLSRLPMGLLSAKGLTTLDVSGCDDLVCTCEEKAVTQFIASHDVYTVLGQCGRTSVHEFFTSLVRGCP